jgi:hypothetical protein
MPKEMWSRRGKAQAYPAQPGREHVALPDAAVLRAQDPTAFGVSLRGSRDAALEDFGPGTARALAQVGVEGAARVDRERLGEFKTDALA